MVIKQSLIKKIQKEFPQFKFSKAKLVTKGWDHYVLILDNNFVFRFARERLYKKSFAREVEFLSRFSKVSSLPVPEYTLLSRDKTFGGYKIIPGVELTGNIYNRFSASKKKTFAKKMGTFLTTLHNFPSKGAPSLGSKPYKTWKISLKQHLKWYNKKFKKIVYNKLKKREIEFIEKFVEKFASTNYKIKPVVGHYDLAHDHIMVNKNGDLEGIIDFGDMSISDPAHEFSGFFDYDSKLASQIYKHYKGHKDPEFLKRAELYFIHRRIYFLHDGFIRRKDPKFAKFALTELRKLVYLNKAI
jgi:aminoglycoside phosphotransferase (APT) family kinase protein